MQIAVQAADLDAERIDGTRVYLLRLLERFGTITPGSKWHLYHRSVFNPSLSPPALRNYEVHSVPFPISWTQTRFAFELFRLRPDRVFLPIQTVPFFLPRKTESIVTIHDLAFKIFPEHFPPRDLRRLNWFTDFSIRKATRLIAVSESTKRDILKFYPGTREDKIRVVYHGFDMILPVTEEARESVLGRFNLVSGEYILYVGALQPRKNLERLLAAFKMIAERYPLMKLVLAGESAWMSEGIIRASAQHAFRERIVLAGRVSFLDRSALYRSARIFVFPSLYEGFGLPILEAFAAGVPAICAGNSSMPEVAGDAAFLFDSESIVELAEGISRLWEDTSERGRLVELGTAQLRKFSWDKCARETAEWILS